MNVVLVTGGEGQLARQLARECRTSGVTGKWCFFPRREWDIGDSRRGEELIKQYSATHIINCAAYTKVDQAEQDPEQAWIVNAEGPAILHRLASANGVKLIHISTDYVGGLGRFLPLHEHEVVIPRGVYAESKRAGEIALLDSPNTLTIRAGWLYSIYGHNFFLTMARRAAQGQRSSVIKDQIGTPTWTGSLARALRKIIEKPSWHPGLYHFSDRGVASWFDFARAIYSFWGHESLVEPIPSTSYPQLAPRPGFSVLNTEKIRRTFAIEGCSWTHALSRCHDEYFALGDTENVK